MVVIKFEQGQQVFWLSSTGFKKGYVKSVRFNSDKYRTETTYHLTCDSYHEEYVGDNVPEDKIFTSFHEMIEYYTNNNDILN